MKSKLRQLILRLEGSNFLHAVAYPIHHPMDGAFGNRVSSTDQRRSISRREHAESFWIGLDIELGHQTKEEQNVPVAVDITTVCTLARFSVHRSKSHVLGLLLKLLGTVSPLNVPVLVQIWN